MSDTFQANLPKLKALSDETRLKIIEMLASGTLCACEILESFHITQPTLSYHMKQLTNCRLVRAERIGAWMYYTLETAHYQQLLDYLANLAIPNPENHHTHSINCSGGKCKEAN